ncbi:ATP SYNTHASE SUBUNIT [Salix koriyanagi]|uniref:ATP SYNTHASE SUBUNIT n=1 Tax=Salix koriyanagi TaxID=2511006 RepID=A0A9Q1A571_9ROSI|nr:ATP SYNTHASE SUBUNIT [Salix koriyanagi]
MASKLTQLQSKACQASKFFSKHGSAYYKQLLEQNKQYIQDPPSVEKCNLLSKQLLYTRLARSASLDLFPLLKTGHMHDINLLHAS